MTAKNIITEAEMLAIPAREISSPDKLLPDPVVSVLIVTYNHEKFIRAAIDGVVKQASGVNFELIIGEDRSTDNTLGICLEYQRKFPELIRIVTWQDNIGVNKNFFRILGRARGKYIALCDGDDYWTDPEKLAKQVAVLEQFPDTTLCGALALVQGENTRVKCAVIKPYSIKEFYDPKDAIQKTLFHTSTMLARKSSLRFRRAAFQVAYLDSYIRVLCAIHGKLVCLPDIVSVYRPHSGGIHIGASFRQNIRARSSLYHALVDLAGEKQAGLSDMRLDIASSICHIAVYEGRITRSRRVFHGVFLPLLRINKPAAFILAFHVYCPTLYQWVKSLKNIFGYVHKLFLRKQKRDLLGHSRNSDSY